MRKPGIQESIFSWVLGFLIRIAFGFFSWMKTI